MTETEEMSNHLVKLAMRLMPEDEGIDVSDHDYSMEQLASMRSLLSSQRRAIDVVSKALAIYWSENHKDKIYDDGVSDWKVGRTKGKRVIDPDMFYEWLSTMSAQRLSKLISPSSIKVGGFMDAERETFLDESPTSDKLSLNSKPHYRDGPAIADASTKEEK